MIYLYFFYFEGTKIRKKNVMEIIFMNFSDYSHFKKFKGKSG